MASLSPPLSLDPLTCTHQLTRAIPAAYQSALLTTPLLLLWLFAHFVFWSWLSTIIFIGSILLIGFTAIRAFRDPSQAHPGGLPGGQLPRYYLPVIGDLAERWVGDE